MLFSLFILQEGREFCVPLCSLFGYVMYEFCGIKEIIEFSRKKESTIHQLLVKVKLHSLWWTKTTNINVRVNSHLWGSSSFVCLSIS